MPSSAASESQQPASSSGTRRQSVIGTIRVIVLVLTVIALLVVALTVELPELDVIQERIESFGPWAWAVFVAAYAVVALTPIPVTIMAATGGVLFGVLAGSVLSVLGAMVGSIGAYWVARAVGKNTVLSLLGSHRASVEERLQDAGYAAVFTMRVMPGVPYWPVNYGAGALGVRFQVFALASLLASIPGQVSLVAIGAFLAEPSIIVGAVLVSSWVVVLVLTVWAWRAWRGSADDERRPGTVAEGRST